MLSSPLAKGALGGIAAYGASRCSAATITAAIIMVTVASSTSRDPT